MPVFSGSLCVAVVLAVPVRYFEWGIVVAQPVVCVLILASIVRRGSCARKSTVDILASRNCRSEASRGPTI